MDANKTFGYRTASEVCELVNAFENCALPRSEWTHATYITVAAWYLYLNPLTEARRLMRNAVRRYDFQNNLAGNLSGGYDEVLSYFWLCEVEAFLKRNRANAPFVELINGLIRRFADGNPPLEYYRQKRFYTSTTTTLADTIPAYDNSGISV